MSEKSNNQGRAYEYVCAMILVEEIKKVRPVILEKNSALKANENAWNAISPLLKNVMTESARAAVFTIFDMEPMLLEKGEDSVVITLQTDKKGTLGDVRDIVLSRKDLRWEIGLSIKHNHFAVKHSRLAKSLDFGAKWYNLPCSSTYWAKVKPIFEYLGEEKRLTKKWEDLPSKENDVYVPLLSAFKNEVLKRYEEMPDLPKKMVEYLLGEFDFYKVISIDTKRVTQIQTYNLHGELNKPSKTRKPKIEVPVACLPKRIISMDFKPNSTNTVELYMDGGWQFNFRIHNASKKVETSLKFDIQIVGMPTAIISVNCFWH
ncbi:MAG: HaeIII family restriction endonuclease [Clostridia bacterium]|nr:HaeIII family restriction endonuclease [Clostridia bacterium]